MRTNNISRFVLGKKLKVEADLFPTLSRLLELLLLRPHYNNNIQLKTFLPIVKPEPFPCS
jgi:hypothetical protein